MDPLDEDVRLLILIVIVEESAIEHDGVVLLGDLVGLRQVGIDVMLSVKFDLGQDATSKGKRGLDCDVKTILVEDWKHAWESNVHKVGIGVWLVKVGAQGGYRE